MYLDYDGRGSGEPWGGLKYYLLRGKRVVRARSLLDWVRSFERTRPFVAQTRGKVGKDPRRVSTIFLGLDHGFDIGRVTHKPVPVIFRLGNDTIELAVRVASINGKAVMQLIN